MRHTSMFWRYSLYLVVAIFVSLLVASQAMHLIAANYFYPTETTFKVVFMASTGAFFKAVHFLFEREAKVADRVNDRIDLAVGAGLGLLGILALARPIQSIATSLAVVAFAGHVANKK